VKTDFLSLTISADVPKRKTILSKNIFASSAISILIVTDIYLIIFVQQSTITKIELYTILRRLFGGKFVTKFIVIFFYSFFATDKNRSSLYDL